MQVVGCREPTRLGSAFLLRPFNGSEKHHSCAGFVGSAARNEKLEICPGIAQGAQFLSQSAWAISDFSGPHVYFFDRIRHAYTSLKNLIASPFTSLMYYTNNKPITPTSTDFAQVIGFYSFLLPSASFHPTVPHIAVNTRKDEGGCSVI